MRGISSSHRATNQQAPTKKPTRKLVMFRYYLPLKFKRKLRAIRDKIGDYIMDAFRNARSIIEINKKIQHIERKLDSSLQTSSELEVKHRRSVNFKLLLLLALWILDKFVLFIFFRYLNVS